MHEKTCSLYRFVHAQGPANTGPFSSSPAPPPASTSMQASAAFPNIF